MAKYICAMCGKQLGFFSGKTILNDGAICNHCLKLGGISYLPDEASFNQSQIVSMIRERKDIVQNFKATGSYGDIVLDGISRSFKVNDNIYMYDNLVDYSFVEYPDRSVKPARKGEAGGAIVGGLVGGLRGGLVGGVIGAAVGNKVGPLFSGTCEYMYISILFKGTFTSNVQLDFIREKTRVSSEEYARAVKEAKKCLDALKIIKADIEANKPKQNYSNTINNTINLNYQQSQEKIYVKDEHMTAAQMADELKVYRDLVEQGFLSQEEYEQKKKQLLAMN